MFKKEVWAEAEQVPLVLEGEAWYNILSNCSVPPENGVIQIRRFP